MDPLSAIGIASAVASFLDLGFKIGKRLAEYQKASPNEVPRSMQSINTQLPLLLNALQRVRTGPDVDRFDLDARCILRGVVAGCIALVEEVETILNAVAKIPGESVATKFRKSLASFRQDDKIMAIDRNLQTYISVLVLHHVIDSDDLPRAPPEDADYFDVREPRADPFSDRDDLLAQLDRLFHAAARSQTKRPVLAALTGPRGVGKTQAALEYCRRSHDAGLFKTVFWLDASSPESLGLSLESTAAIVRRSTEGTRTEKLDFVKTFLSERWHPWLLVLDGFVQKAFDGVDVMRFLPPAGYGAILVTTSDKSLFLARAGTVEVPKFLTDEEKEGLKYSLTRAISRTNLEQVQSCISRGATINELDPNDWPHITRAAVNGDATIFGVLLEHGADPDFKRGYKEHPLYWASDDGYADIVEMILDHEDGSGQRIDQDDYDRSMRAAVKKGHAKVVRTLLARRQVNLDQRDPQGASMLRMAVKGGSGDLVRLCLERGVVPGDDEEKGEILVLAASTFRLDLIRMLIETGKFGANLRNRDGYCSLMYAIEVCNRTARPGDPDGLEMAEYLLGAGADPNAVSRDDSFFGDRTTPVHSAAQYGSPEKMRLLLAHGGDLARQDRNGYNALIHFRSTDRTVMDPILLGTPMPDPLVRSEYLNKGLLRAAEIGNRDLALAVLRAGADRTSIEKHGEGNERGAASGGGGVDIDAVDEKGRTPLLLAIRGEKTQFVRMLLRHGPRQDLPDQKGELPLFAAIDKGLDLTVRDLLRAGAAGAAAASSPKGQGEGQGRGQKGPGPDLKNARGETALCVAAAAGNEKVLKVLLDFGADPEEPNAYGDTPLDLAEEKGHEKVVKLLEEMSLEKV